MPMSIKENKTKNIMTSKDWIDEITERTPAQLVKWILFDGEMNILWFVGHAVCLLMKKKTIFCSMNFWDSMGDCPYASVLYFCSIAMHNIKISFQLQTMRRKWTWKATPRMEQTKELVTWLSFWTEWIWTCPDIPLRRPTISLMVSKVFTAISLPAIEKKSKLILTVFIWNVAVYDNLWVC